MDIQPGSAKPGTPARLEDVYELIGGMDACRKLATTFYSRVAGDPLLRPMFGADLQPAIEHLALFLAQRFGGPATYSAERGHPRLRMRHAPFRIGQAERDAWLEHMLAAIDEQAIGDPARALLHRYFEDTAVGLTNVIEGPTGGKWR